MSILRERTVIGVVWTFVQQFGQRGVSLVSTLLLAYFLVPEDFGLMAMLAVFIAIANGAMDAGFRQALIRKVDATVADVNTIFYANVTLGIVCYGLIFATAPAIAEFYDEPRIAPLIRVVSIVIVFQSLQVVQVAELSRALNFKLQAMAAVPSTILGGASAVGLAYLGWGVWALVGQMVVASLTLTAGLWIRVGWRPKRIWSNQSLREFFGFSGNLFLVGLLEQIFYNLYVVVIAKAFAASTAGYYFFAYKIKDLFANQLIATIQTVTYPTLAKLQNEPARLKAGLRQVMQVSTFLLAPGLVLMAALAEPVFQLLLPAKWLPAVPFLQLLCLGHILHPIHSINVNTFKVVGRSDSYFRIELGKKALTAIGIYVGLQFGVFGILINQVVLSVLFYWPNSYASRRYVGYSAREQLRDCLPSLLLACGIALTVYGAARLADWPPAWKIAVLGGLAVVAYVVGAAAMKIPALGMVRDMALRLPIWGLRGRPA